MKMMWSDRSCDDSDLYPSDHSWLTQLIHSQLRHLKASLRDQVDWNYSTPLLRGWCCFINDSNFHFSFLIFSIFAGSSTNGISPLLFNAGLVSHYRRYLNPVDPRMFVTNANVTELNKSNCKGKNRISISSLESSRVALASRFISCQSSLCDLFFRRQQPEL